jgi:phage FluMu gp28-like protein
MQQQSHVSSPIHKLGKNELRHFSKLRMAFEKSSLRVPVNRAVREDLHSINRVSSPTGQIIYRAPHNNADGHADRCTALALALHAAGDGHVSLSIESFSRYGQSDWPWKNIRKPLSPGGHGIHLP